MRALRGITMGITLATSLYMAETTKKYGRDAGKADALNRSTPSGFRSKAATVAAFGVQPIQARQIGNLQAAEVAKFEQRAAELQPKIDACRAEAKSV